MCLKSFCLGLLSFYPGHNNKQEQRKRESLVEKYLIHGNVARANGPSSFHKKLQGYYPLFDFS